jgi:hypothetical protein
MFLVYYTHCTDRQTKNRQPNKMVLVKCGSGVCSVPALAIVRLHQLLLTPGLCQLEPTSSCPTFLQS